MNTMFTLSATPIAAEYLANTGKECKLGRYTVTVCKYENESQSGSYERGFKWTRTTYGYLKRKLAKKGYYVPTHFSVDHGATWHDNMAAAKKQRAGKVKLDVNKTQEFAFEGIQKINKEYNRSYQWNP